MKEKLQPVLIAVFITVVLVSSIGIVFAENNSQESGSGYYELEMVIEKEYNLENNLTNIYSFFVINNGVVQPSNIITVPFGKAVKITIINYDDGISLPMTPTSNLITGVVNDSISIYGQVTVANVHNLGLQSGKYTNDIPISELSHTFSTSTGLSIPIIPNSTVVAYTYFNTVGNYTWGCMCDCGIVSMSTGGSMVGQFVVLPP